MVVDYEALLYGLASYKQAVSQAEKDYLKTPFKMDADKASSELKKHMEEEGVEEMWDHERGAHATVTSRKNKEWDLRTAPDEVVLYLAREGLLTVREQSFRQRRIDAPSTKLDDAVKFKTEGAIPVLKTELTK